MRKSLTLVLGILFVLGLAVSAFADVTLSGDARVRGIWKNNYDFDDSVDTADKDIRYWDQRVRLAVTAKVAGDGDAEVRARVKIGEGKWDGLGETKADVATDYAYLHVPIGSVTIDAGRQVVNFGNKFYVWDGRADRLMVSTKAGDTSISAFTDKVDETSAANLKDSDNYGLIATGKLGALNAGAILVYENNAVTDKTGTEGSVSLSGDVGGLGIAAEVAFKGGDLNEDTAGNSPMGGFVSVSKRLEALSVSGALAYAANGYTADNHFTPTVFFGTDQPTAIMDFKAISDATTFGGVASATYKATNDLSVTGAVAYASLEKQGVGGKDGKVTELDARAKYDIAKNVTWYLDLGYLIPSDMSAKDDAAMALAHKLEIKF